MAPIRFILNGEERSVEGLAPPPRFSSTCADPPSA